MINEKAYAKINLGLKVLGKRIDGFHDLDMLMVSIDLHDDLNFVENDKIIIESNDFKHIPLEDNLIYKTIKLVQSRFNIVDGIKVEVIKCIPEQAGLAGGSSDAAATLRALNKLWNLRLDLDQLADLGKEIGSDVPFCIYSKLARVRGRGEIVEKIKLNFDYNVILIVPDFCSSTKDIFSHYTCVYNNESIKNLINSFKNNKITLFNDLEVTYKKIDPNKYKKIIDMKSVLLEHGAVASIMSGSGSVVYGLFEKCYDLTIIINKIRNITMFKDCKFILSKTVN